MRSSLRTAEPVQRSSRSQRVKVAPWNSPEGVIQCATPSERSHRRRAPSVRPPNPSGKGAKWGCLQRPQRNDEEIAAARRACAHCGPREPHAEEELPCDRHDGKSAASPPNLSIGGMVGVPLRVPGQGRIDIVAARGRAPIVVHANHSRRKNSPAIDMTANLPPARPISR